MSNELRSLAAGKLLRLGAAAVALALGALAPAAALAKDYGKPGEPVHLTIGYQPYYTQAWSAVIQKEMKPWEKYLPKGSTVTWEIGLMARSSQRQPPTRPPSAHGRIRPSIAIATQHRELRMVALLAGQRQCSVFLSRRRRLQSPRRR